MVKHTILSIFKRHRSPQLALEYYLCTCVDKEHVFRVQVVGDRPRCRPCTHGNLGREIRNYDSQHLFQPQPTITKSPYSSPCSPENAILQALIIALFLCAFCLSSAAV